MTVLYFLVPLALLLAALAVLAFRWAAITDQFEDLESPAIRLLTEGESIDANLAPEDSR